MSVRYSTCDVHMTSHVTTCMYTSWMVLTNTFSKVCYKEFISLAQNKLCSSELVYFVVGTGRIVFKLMIKIECVLHSRSIRYLQEVLLTLNYF